MTFNGKVDERISLCRFLEKVEGQKAFCASIGVRDASRFRGRGLAQRNRNVVVNRKQI